MARKISCAGCTSADAGRAFARLRPVRNRSQWDRPHPMTGWPDVLVQLVGDG